MTNKILITGVAGLLGSRLASWILENTDNIVIGIDDLSGGHIENMHPNVKFYKFNLVDLDEVGISKSINGIETEFTRWVNAFSIYSELEFAHADSYRLQVGATSGYMADQFSFLSAQNVQTKISNEYLDKLMESVELVL